MKIGINLLPFSHRSGIECYTENLLAELLNDDDEFYLYYTDKLPFPIPAPRSNIHFFKISTRIPMTLYLQLVFPFVCWLAKIDIVLSTCPTHPIVLLRRNVVIIYDCAYHAFPENAGSILRLLLIKVMCWCAIKFSKEVVTVSDFSVGEIGRVYGLGEKPVKNISAGVPSVVKINESIVEKTLAKYELNSNGYIFFVASVQPHKNLLAIISAFSNLSKGMRGEVKLVVAGRLSSMEKDVINVVTNSDIADSVQVLGFIDEVDKICLIQESLGVCIASLYEGFGLPIVEAQSLGVPVLTSNICSMPEVVGEGGILVDPYDEADIARGMQKLIHLSDDDRRLIGELSSINLARFSWSQCAELLMDSVKA